MLEEYVMSAEEAAENRRLGEELKRKGQDAAAANLRKREAYEWCCREVDRICPLGCEISMNQFYDHCRSIGRLEHAQSAGSALGGLFGRRKKTWEFTGRTEISRYSISHGEDKPYKVWRKVGGPDGI